MAADFAQRLAVCSWSLQPQSPADLITKLEAVGLKRTQLGLVPLIDAADRWGDAPDLLKDAGVEIVSGMFGTYGEDYSSLDSIRLTGGVVPDEHWDANFDRVIQVADLAGSLGLSAVSFHAGFIPEEPQDPGFEKLVDRIRQIAQRFAEKNIALLMETGQESADSLVRFINAVEQPNLGVNFDPANMILYGMGDPTDALRTLMPHVQQVHIKDAVASDTPGQWGAEAAVGQGQVDWPAFVKVLREGHYTGPLVIEREGGDDRLGDVKAAVNLIMSLG